MKILKVISVVLFLFCATSCVTERQRAKICNSCSVTSFKKDSIVYVKKDTSIYITIPGPIQYLENPCKELCDSLGNLKSFKISKKKNGIKGTVKSIGKSIVFECETDSLKTVIGLLEKQIYQEKQNSLVKYLDCSREHKTSWDGFTFWFFWIVAPLILIWFAWRYLKMYLKL